MYFDKNSYVAIIPSYNEAQTLPGIVREILKKNIQVIVIDDHSTDNSYKLLQNFEIILLRNSKRLGYEESLNRGFQIAKKKILNIWSRLMPMDNKTSRILTGFLKSS